MTTQPKKRPWKYEPETKTIRSVPSNYWLATIDSLDKAVNNKVGCSQKTFAEWIKWLESKEEYQTKRDTPEFKLIENAIRFLCESEDK